jgi:hypothetical protein
MLIEGPININYSMKKFIDDCHLQLINKACPHLFANFCILLEIKSSYIGVMPNYLELIAQVREAAENKQILEPIDYTTDLFVRDVSENNLQDWKKILDDINNHITSATIEINEKLNKGWVFIDESEVSESYTDVSDLFDPFGPNGFPFIFKRPDNRFIILNKDEDLKRVEIQKQYFDNLEWINGQMVRIEKCFDFFDEHKEKKPFRKGNGLPTIPFFGNQTSFIAVINLLINGGFIPLKRKDPKKDLEDFELTNAEYREYENYIGLFSKDLAVLFAEYFHSIKIEDKISSSGEKKKKIFKEPFNSETIKKKLSGSNISDGDAEKLLALESHFEKILKKIREYKKEKITGSQML